MLLTIVYSMQSLHTFCFEDDLQPPPSLLHAISFMLDAVLIALMACANTVVFIMVLPLICLYPHLYTGGRVSI